MKPTDRATPVADEVIAEVQRHKRAIMAECGDPIRRIQGLCPSVGSIRALQVTDKQYARIKILLGNRTPDECTGGQQLLFF